MTKYKVTSMNVGFGEKQYTINRIDGIDIIPTLPIKYYKSKKTANKALIKRFFNGT